MTVTLAPIRPTDLIQNLIHDAFKRRSGVDYDVNLRDIFFRCMQSHILQRSRAASDFMRDLLVAVGDLLDSDNNAFLKRLRRGDNGCSLQSETCSPHGASLIRAALTRRRQSAFATACG